MATSPVQLVGRARHFLAKDLWTADFEGKGWAGSLLGAVQLVALIVRGFVDDQLLLRASALTYISSLAIIPVMVVALSIIDWLGLSKDLVVLVANQFLAGSPDAVDTIMAVVEGAKVGAFGSASGAVFFATTILSLRHAEETFNEIWGVAQSRSWVRRFTNYLAVLVVVPLVLGTLISLSPSLGIESLESELDAVPMAEQLEALVTGGGPLVFLFFCFGFAYYVLPNTAVRLKSAVIGALVAAGLFWGAQYVYVSFSVGVARYDSLFGGFAIVPLLLVWIYVSWSIVLLGAEIAYAHQHLAQYRRDARASQPEPAEREAVGLRVMLELGRAFRDAWPPQRAAALAERLGSPIRVVSELLARFERAGVVTLCGAEEGDRSYQLGRDAQHITLGEIFAAIIGERRERPVGPGADVAIQGVVQGAAAVLGAADEALQSVRDRPLADVLREIPPQDSPDAP